MEGIEELASEHREEVARLTDAAMRGELPLEQVYGRRLDLVRPGRARMEALGRQYVERLVPDAREVARALLDEGIDVRWSEDEGAPTVPEFSSVGGGSSS